MQPIHQLVRIRSLQIYCWETNKKRWAKALGKMLRELREDFPELKRYQL